MDLQSAREFAYRRQQIETAIAERQPNVEDPEKNPFQRFVDIVGAISMMSFMEGYNKRNGDYVPTRYVQAETPAEGDSPALTVVVAAIDVRRLEPFNPDTASILMATWTTPSGVLAQEEVARHGLAESLNARHQLERIEESFDALGTMQQTSRRIHLPNMI